VVFFIAVLLVALAVAAIAAFSRVAGIVVGIPIAIVAVIAVVFVTVFSYFVSLMVIVSIALEEPNPIRGIGHGLRRTFGRAMFWRSALVATSLFFVSFAGGLVLSSIGALLAALTHWGPLFLIVTAIGNVALNALLTTFIVVYAFDVRVRREGYDLELAVAGAGR
jgi:hypothetical protein